MLFFVVVLIGLVLWAVFAAVVATTSDTDRHAHHHADADTWHLGTVEHAASGTRD